jgi:hypothetical protein
VALLDIIALLDMTSGRDTVTEGVLSFFPRYATFNGLSEVRRIQSLVKPASSPHPLEILFLLRVSYPSTYFLSRLFVCLPGLSTEINRVDWLVDWLSAR